MEDTQQQEFFRSVSEAFERNRHNAGQSFELILLGIVIILVALQAVGWWRRMRGLKLDVEQLAHQRGLVKDELNLVLALARASSTAPMQLLTHLDVFERVTASALKGELRVFLSGGPLAESLRRIRHALHFDRLPTHAPLLSTRELSPGTAVDFGANHGTVTRCDEATFTLELRAPATLTAGATVSLVLTHAREARYELHCRLRELAHGTQLVLEHDEAPTRVQQREYARAPASGPIKLHAVSWPGHAIGTREFPGELRDLGGGGALVSTRAVLPAGVVLSATFTVGGQSFEDLRAVVLASHAKGDRFESHVEFADVAPPERERLIAAVAKLQQSPRGE